MTFTRKQADNWHREVPGARWFKADLHIHTIDDHAGRRAKLPPGISGPIDSPQTIEAYARHFLKGAIAAGVGVLGVTPHSARVGTGPDASAVWAIVEQWNTGSDDDGTLFREKIYAVFPGFEPSLSDGRGGLHLAFLFDPEIGRDNYLRAFELVMRGVSPWSGNQLQMSGNNSSSAFEEIREFHAKTCTRDRHGMFEWSYIVLAPHIDNEKGLLGAQKAQVLDRFGHEELAGLELGDNKLPDDTLVQRPGLQNRMAEHHQAFYHSTDAYSVDEIGNRYTWVKLASPRIEALRQAFIASDSRLRIAYERASDGNLVERAGSPDVTVSQRRWLKSVTVTGGASFFTPKGDRKSGAEIRLSPDLTCVIGGSMTGKSTLLDGLRVYVGALAPEDAVLARDVEGRGRDRFLAGSPEVTLDCPGQDPTAPLQEQWPAQFYTQNELQQLAQASGSVEEIIARLVAQGGNEIEDRESSLTDLDRELRTYAQRLTQLEGRVAEVEQALDRSQAAATELVAFSDAGVDRLNYINTELRRWQDAEAAIGELVGQVSQVSESFNRVEIPDISGELATALRESDLRQRYAQTQIHRTQIDTSLGLVTSETESLNSIVQAITQRLMEHERLVRAEVDRELAARGLEGTRINELQALNRQASLIGSYRSTLEAARTEFASAQLSFEALLEERQQLVESQRDAFDRVAERIRSAFRGRYLVRRVDHGLSDRLDRFIRDLGQRGVTRWWNDLQEYQRPSPQRLLELFRTGELYEVGMSTAVQTTFGETLSRSNQRELATIRCRDLYLLELLLDDGSYRPLDDLSGGRRVSLLLSLLLETYDDRPLVIDQPEDQLDNRFLFDDILPALKRLKGRRQVILATHNPNIVVNGDADLIIQLEATADRGNVAVTGAIEEPTVRDAIVGTVDGGNEAFRLRRLKYGF